MRKDLGYRFIVLILIGDASVLYGSFLLAYFIRVNFMEALPLLPIHSLTDYNPGALIVIGLTLIANVFLGLYDMGRKLSMIDSYINIMKAIVISLLIALTLTFFFKYYERSRSLVMVFLVCAIFCSILYRWVVSLIIKYMRKHGRDNLNVVILGIDKKGLAVEKIFSNFSELGYRTIAALSLDPKKDLKNDKMNSLISESLAKKIANVMVKKRVDGVILTLPINYYEQMVDIVEWCEEKGIEAHYITSVVDVLNTRAIRDELQENLFFNTRNDFTNIWKDLTKRLMDELISIPIFLITSPLWLAIALAIKLDSPGPFFFKQERVGKMGRHFIIYKFRTMYTTAPKYSSTPKGKQDTRITKIGAFLRQTSLDELPQLINVIKGDMSLVGPRPEQPFLVEKYNRAIYHRRHLVLPGVTGLWQVSGRSDKPMEENIKYDLYYIRHRSLLFDIMMLLRTIPAVLSKKGAY